MTRRRHRRARRWAAPLAITAVAIVMTASIAYAVTTVFDQSAADVMPKSGSDGSAIVVQPAAVGAKPVDHVLAEPEATNAHVVLDAPDDVSPGAEVEFEVGWNGEGGRAITGELELQRIDGRKWTTVTTVAVDGGEGTASVKVPSSGLYRAAYGGSDELPAVESQTVAVLTGEPMPSRLVTTMESGNDGDTAVVTGAWTTKTTLAIVGELELQVEKGDGWDPVSTAVTDTSGLATAEVEASETARYRFVYSGGSRFAKVASEPAVIVGSDVRTVQVSECSTSGEIDALARGAACHYTPVSVGTFVVGHDYLGNAWWNTVSMGTHIKLTGEQAGLYKVVDRVMAPARGSALGPASNWTCGGNCDVVLQTCRGSNTGFTWLRRVDTSN